jgi:hypothetical protein
MCMTITARWCESPELSEEGGLGRGIALDDAAILRFAYQLELLGEGPGLEDVGGKGRHYVHFEARLPVPAH